MCGLAERITKPFSPSSRSNWQRTVRFAARFAPCRDHVFAETFLHSQSRKESPRLVMAVFVKNSHAAFWHNVAKFFDQ